MAVTVLGLWEQEWMDYERTERRIWKQTIQAFNVDRWIMVAGQEGEFTSPDQYQSIDDAIASLDQSLKWTLLVPPSTSQSIPLEHYVHPENAVYIFGDTHNHMMGYMRESDDMVSIYTPTEAAMFAHAVLPAVLHDRLVKQ